jgi:hypothetical protein
VVEDDARDGHNMAPLVEDASWGIGARAHVVALLTLRQNSPGIWTGRQCTSRSPEDNASTTGQAVLRPEGPGAIGRSVEAATPHPVDPVGPSGSAGCQGKQWQSAHGHLHLQQLNRL